MYSFSVNIMIWLEFYVHKKIYDIDSSEVNFKASFLRQENRCTSFREDHSVYYNEIKILQGGKNPHLGLVYKSEYLLNIYRCISL